LLNCVLTFATFHHYREWPDDLVRRLWLVGEIFANSLLRAKTEEKSRRLQEQLTRLVRVTLVGELAAAIAHEVNQPLCAIVSNAQAAQRLLAAEQPDMDEVRETLHDIAADSRRANEVVARIRAMLQKQTPERSPLQLADAAREVAALIYGPAMQKGVSLSLQLAPDLPPVLGDRVQLQQVMLNLALNALDAMSQPEIETRRLSMHAVRDQNERVIVSVRDTGPGIAPQHLGEIFDAFFTTKPTGLGVGLAISRSIVESHGGRIWVESEPGGGAEFHFALPSINGSQA
jgi:two-component system sensor kinase FixL